MKSIYALYKQTLTFVILALLLASCGENQENKAIDNQAKQDNSETTPHFINFTDLHFTPFFDSTLVAALDKHEYTKWDSVFQLSENKNISNYGHETNYQLFSLMLKSMKENTPNPDFIIFAGDFICHDFGEKYQHFTKNDSKENLHIFISKTLKYIASKLKDNFNDVSMIPALGNNDAFCGDYQVRPYGKFLKEFVEIWQFLLKDSKSFSEEFFKVGYYITSNPKNPKHKFIVLNSILFSEKFQSKKYNNFCECDKEYEEEDWESYADNQLRWLDNTIAKCRTNDEKVWIISHIPIGIDVYSTMKKKKAGIDEPVGYWKEEYAHSYMKILETYSNVVTATLSGHTHMDDFKVIQYDNKKLGFVHITPSVSPVFNNNPSYQLVDYDITAAVFSDYRALYINLDEEFNQWSDEYRFSALYGLENITTESLDKIQQSMEDGSTNKEQYMRYFPVLSTHGSFITDSNWPYYYKAISNVLRSEYSETEENK